MLMKKFLAGAVLSTLAAASAYATVPPPVTYTFDSLTAIEAVSLPGYMNAVVKLTGVLAGDSAPSSVYTAGACTYLEWMIQNPGVYQVSLTVTTQEGMMGLYLQNSACSVTRNP